MKSLLTLTLSVLSFWSIAQTSSKNTILSFKKENYSIQYPKTWSLDTSGLMGSKLFLFSALENESDKFKENVNVMVQDLGGQDISLAQYAEISEPQIKSLLTDAKIYESTVITTAKVPYYKLMYSMKQGLFTLKIESLCYIKNRKAYLITFCAEFDKFDLFKNEGEQILKSFVVD
jgi:PsbP